MSLLRPGDILGDKHRIDAVLGEGGFGIVFRGTTLETNRPIAVKVLKLSSAANADVRVHRFMRELRAIANLCSPYTVTLFDYGYTPSGNPYMVTEFVDGEDLSELLGRVGPLRPAVAVKLLLHALDSLAEAHDAGILHRDIKPQNLRVMDPLGPTMRLKVLDFGLAKSMGEADAALTAKGRVIGTPRYMSPEQIRGQELTPASDIFSLGLVAYEMLVGTQSAAWQERVPGQPLHVSVGEPLAAGLRVIVNRMLASEPSERYVSAREASAALRALPRNGGDAAPASARPEPRRAEPYDTPTVADTAADHPTIRARVGEASPRRTRRPLPEAAPLPSRLIAASLLGATLLVVAVYSAGRGAASGAVPVTERRENPLLPAPSEPTAEEVEAAVALEKGRRASERTNWLRALRYFRQVEGLGGTPAARELAASDEMDEAFERALWMPLPPAVALPTWDAEPSAIEQLAGLYPADARVLGRLAASRVVNRSQRRTLVTSGRYFDELGFPPTPETRSPTPPPSDRSVEIIRLNK